MITEDSAPLTDSSLHLTRPTSSGLDLSDPRVYELCRRIYYHRFSARVRWAGIDPDDGFQDVCLRLISRQSGRSRYDPAKSGLSNYLFIAMQGICINLADSARRRGRTVLGGTDDVASTCEAEADAVVTSRHVEELASEMEVPVAVVHALADGEDPFVAAMEAGLDFIEAASLVQALGMR